MQVLLVPYRNIFGGDSGSHRDKVYKKFRSTGSFVSTLWNTFYSQEAINGSVAKIGGHFLSICRTAQRQKNITFESHVTVKGYVKTIIIVLPWL